MKSTARADIVPLLHHLCLALQPYASSQNITISFSTCISFFEIDYHAGVLIKDMSEILCAIISFLPNHNSINVTTSVETINDNRVFQLTIYNSGINLSRISEITAGCKFPVSVINGVNETYFIINIPVRSNTGTQIAPHDLKKANNNIPVFFQQMRQRLKSHFIKIDPPEISPPGKHLKNSAFLKKLHEVILKHIDKENFDANALSKEMTLSRAQLLRNLKPLISQSPACYIKHLRLQRAKELLEKEDLSVGEVAYKTGFKTPSHFTKVFTQKYGIRPSVFRRPKI